MFYLLLAFLAGVSIVISRMINYQLSEKIGIYQSTFFNYVVGLVCSSAFLVLSQEFATLSLSTFSWKHVFASLGGLIGVIVVALSSYMAPKISVFYLTLFIFIGQLFVGALIDYFSLGAFSLGKIIGGFFVLLGLIYNLMLDKGKEAL